MTAQVKADFVSQFTVHYTIVGSFEEVSEAVDHELRRWHPSGYGTWFNWPPNKIVGGKQTSYMAPVEKPPGVWTARGHRGTSCD